MKIVTVRSSAYPFCFAVALTLAIAQSDTGQQQQQEQEQQQRRLADTPTGPVVVQPPPQGRQRPQYQDLRYDEDWSHIKEVQGPEDFWDPIKYILLDQDRGWYMTLGGEIRERWDNWKDAYYGSVPGGMNASMQRYMFHADTHFGEHFRLFVQTQSALEYGKKTGPLYTDKDAFDFHQAFFDIRSSNDPKNYTFFRFGFQEFALGADHFISTGDYFNARRNFLGAKFVIARGRWQWLVQATKPVLNLFGSFDDVPEHGRTSWGGGFFAPNPWTEQGRVGVFYTALDTKKQLWNRGLGRDLRHTLGARIEGNRKGWDYTYEGLAQIGTFTPVQGPSVPIHAWAATTDDGFTFQRSRHYPRVGLVTSFTSGDSGQGALGTFHALFPDSAYSGKLGLIGPSNVYGITPNFRFLLVPRVYVMSEWAFFFRQNIHDGIYTPSVPFCQCPIESGIISFIERPGNLSNARYIGNQAGIASAVTIDRHFTYIVAYNFFTPGKFLKQTPPAVTTGFLLMFINYNF